MLTAIIFSLNRALLLEALLKSFQDNFLKENKSVEIIILYGATNEKFEEGYEILKNRINDKRIKFVKKERGKYKTDLSLFLRPRNFYYYLKYPYYRDVSKIFNYKELLENIIESSKSKCVSFFTDDSLFFKNVDFNSSVADIVCSNPEQNSFSLRHGLNIRNKPDDLSIYNDYYTWNFHNATDKHWHYYFSIDGHIYDREFLLSHIKKILYVNPNSFESIVFRFSELAGYFSKGFCFENSVLAGFEVNMVQSNDINNNLGINNDFLNDSFLSGFKLKYVFNTEMQDFRPNLEQLILINEKTQEQKELIQNTN